MLRNTDKAKSINHPAPLYVKEPSSHRQHSHSKSKEVILGSDLRKFNELNFDELEKAPKENYLVLP